MRTTRNILFFLLLSFLMLLFSQDSSARPPIRKAFFNVYASAKGTRLDNLPSSTGHCGVCHFDFNGGGARNPYGVAVQTAIPQNATIELAIQSMEGSDQDNDTFSSLTEITDTAHFGNTPTFPGLTAGNVSQVLNVNVADLTGYLTPT